MAEIDSDLLHEAADTIERLRAEVKDRDVVCDSYAKENGQFHAEIERLRADKDVQRSQDRNATYERDIDLLEIEVERLKTENWKLRHGAVASPQTLAAKGVIMTPNQDKGDGMYEVIEEGQVMTTHNLKCWVDYYGAIKDDSKRFDLRKDDRNYQVGDQIVFEEFRPGVGEYTGNKVVRRIVYVLRNFDGLMPGYCVLGF